MTDYSPPDIEDPGLPKTSLSKLKVLLKSITTSCGRKWDVILELDGIGLPNSSYVKDDSPLSLSSCFLLLLLLLLVGGVHQGGHGKRRGPRKEKS